MSAKNDKKSNWIAFSVDLEPNLDGTLNGVKEAMEWYDDTVPTGTIFTTHTVVKELPDMIRGLADNHEIGVHVHPNEFDFDHDKFAKLPIREQTSLIKKTRNKIESECDINAESITSFRAGRHSIDRNTFEVLSSLGFTTDASINIEYGEKIDDSVVDIDSPTPLYDGILEIPTTYTVPRLFSGLGIRALPRRTITATSSTVRIDRRGLSGSEALREIWSQTDSGFSFYMHPHDASGYHTHLENNGETFRNRIEEFLQGIREGTNFVQMSEISEFTT